MLGSMDSQLQIARAGKPQRTRECLEKRFNFVMIGASVQDFQMNIAREPRAKPSKKSGSSSVCRSPTIRTRTFVVDHVGGAPAQVDRSGGQRLIHRHQKIAGAQNPFLIAQRLRKCLSQSDTDVLHRVVLIDIQIALTNQIEIECLRDAQTTPACDPETECRSATS